MKLSPHIQDKYQVRLNRNVKNQPKDRGFGKSNTMRDKPDTTNFHQNLLTDINTKDNIAILTGKINNLTIVECDFYDKGDYAFDRDTNNFCQQFGFPSKANNYLVYLIWT